MTIQLEAKKHGYRQTQDGIVISFVVHPDDMLKAPELATALLGTNYGMVLVEITPGESPAEQPVVEKTEGQFAVQMAGILCGDDEFVRWLQVFCGSGDPPEIIVRQHCGVMSRTEFATDVVALEKWQKLLGKYRAHQSYHGLEVGL